MNNEKSVNGFIPNLGSEIYTANLAFNGKP